MSYQKLFNYPYQSTRNKKINISTRKNNDQDKKYFSSFYPLQILSKFIIFVFTKLEYGHPFRMNFRYMPLLTIFLSNFITILCQDSLPNSKEIPLWEKVSAILGIVFIIISAVLYATRNRNINVRVLIRGYISPSQAEVTFVNFKHDHERGVEAVIQTNPPSRAQQLDEDNNCLSK